MSYFGKGGVVQEIFHSPFAMVPRADRGRVCVTRNT